MAIEAMVAVFDESTSTGSARCIMLAVANQASAWGELSAYARSRKYLCRIANVSQSTFKRALPELVASGELEVTEVGIGRTQSSYLIHLPSLCSRRGCAHGGEGSTLDPLNSDLNEPSEGSQLDPLTDQRGPLHHPVLPTHPVGAASIALEADDVSASSILDVDSSIASPPAPRRQQVPGRVHDPEQVQPAQFNRDIRIRSTDALTRMLAVHGVTVSNRQVDQRLLAKLSEIRPSTNELDGVCNVLLAMEGRIDLGRLVAKWDVLKTEAPKPAAWRKPADAVRERQAKFIELGGNPYDLEARHDYDN